jgi:hypothetical protein
MTISLCACLQLRGPDDLGLIGMPKRRRADSAASGHAFDQNSTAGKARIGEVVVLGASGSDVLRDCVVQVSSWRRTPGTKV